MGTLDFTDSIYDAQQGSQSAIKFIYDNTIHLFYKEACVFMRDKNEADLAVQEAYDFIFNHLDSLEDSSKFLVWANEVCKNTCISRLKQAGAFDERIPAEAANLGEISASADYDPMINMNAVMPATHVQACLDAILNSLPDNQRTSAILWGEGYPVRSISRKLGISRAAVNYTLAYALGNITNSVTTLKDNGLPLYSMEPIPYFLWLLISYYQYYQPENLDSVLVHSGFPSVLRKILPDEASIYSSEFESIYPETPEENTDSKVQHITEPAGESDSSAASSEAFAKSLDLSDFISSGSEGNEKKPEDTGLEEPDMEIYPAHPEDEAAPSEESADSSDKDSEDEDTGSEEKAASDADKETTSEEEIDSIFGAVAADTAASSEAASSETVSETPSDSESTASEASENENAADKPPVELLDEKEDKKKRHTGLLIALIIIAALVLIFAAAMIFGGNTLRKKVNDLLGTNLFTLTESVTVPESTETEPVTEEPTTPEPTTPEPTTTEPETTTPEETTTAPASLPYDVTIYADGIALGMRAVPGGDDNQPRLTYIPSDTRITIDTIENSWGHTTYTDEDGTYDGWIWMGFTKVADNAPVEEPAQLLETPEAYTVTEVAGTAELRTGPGSNYSTFGPIPEGTSLSIEGYDASGVWGYTSYNGHHGWITLY